MLDKDRIKRIYALASKCGLLDDEDTLHLIVMQRTGLQHISELTDAQADEIISELKAQCRSSEPRKEMSTAEQRGLCFRLMYRLAQLDPSPNEPSVRLGGIIARVTGREINADRDIFYGVTRKEASAVIDCLKRMINRRKAALKRAKRGDNNGTCTAGKAEPP